MQIQLNRQDAENAKINAERFIVMRIKESGISITRSLGLVIVSIAVILLLVSFGLPAISNLMTSCDHKADLLVDSKGWRITDSNLPAEIIWQKSEPIARSSYHLGFPNTSFVASDGKVIYWQTSGGLSCDNQPIIAAFDTTSGKEVWRYRPQELSTKIFTIQDGYILLGVSGIIKLDQSGQVSWRQVSHNNIPFRDFTTMYEIGDQLLFPAQPGETYIISAKTGELISNKNMGQVMAIFDHFALIKAGESNLALIDLAKNYEVMYTINLPSDRFSNTSLNSIFPFAVRNQDKLLLYFDSTSFEVRDFLTGNLLWEFNKPLFGVPVISGDLVIVYALNNRLEIYDLQNGKLLGNVQLASDAKPVDNDSSLRFSAWITAYQDMIYIRQLDRPELIAIKLDLSKIHD